MHEVEVKLRLGPEEDLAEALRRFGATAGLPERQEDTYFSHPARDLAASDEALRLRRQGARLELTYKGPRQGGRVKSRLEHQVELRDDPGALLAALGFAPAAHVGKTRTPWQRGEVHFAVDEVDGLGRFLEVEVVSDDAKDAARRVEAALAALGLQDRPREAASYLELQARL